MNADVTAAYARLAAPIVADDLALVPLTREHESTLAAAFADADLWTWMLAPRPASRADVRVWIDEALAHVAAERHAAFVTVLPDGTFAGTTRFLEIARTIAVSKSAGRWSSRTPAAVG